MNWLIISDHLSAAKDQFGILKKSNVAIKRVIEPEYIITFQEFSIRSLPLTNWKPYSNSINDKLGLMKFCTMEISVLKLTEQTKIESC